MTLENFHVAPLGIVPWKAAAAITKYQLVKIAGERTCDVAGAGELAIGIAMHDIASGSWGDICCAGEYVGIADASITVGDVLIAAAAGELATIGAVADTTYNVCGQASTAAAANANVGIVLNFYVMTTESA